MSAHQTPQRPASSSVSVTSPTVDSPRIGGGSSGRAYAFSASPNNPTAVVLPSGAANAVSGVIRPSSAGFASSTIREREREQQQQQQKSPITVTATLSGLQRHNSTTSNGGDFSGGSPINIHQHSAAAAIQQQQQQTHAPFSANFNSNSDNQQALGGNKGEVMPFSPNSCSPKAIKSWVTLNVGGTIFSTTRATLLQDRESLLYAMFRPDSEWDLDIDDKGHVLLDADGQYFGPILNFLRMNEVAIPPNVSNKGVLACAQYFNVQGVLDYFNRDKRQVVFSCGSGSSGELGTLDRLDVLTPSAVTIVPYNCRIVSVALGANYSCVLTNNGKVYTFGNGDWGQLGLGNPKEFTEKAEDRTPIVTIPTVIPALEKKFVTAISSGYAYAMVLTQDHEVYFWGNNNHGQSGLGPSCFGLPHRKIETPVLVDTLQGKQIIQLGCGSFFVLALSADGSMYSWGLVDCLGLGTLEQVFALCKSTDELAESVSKDRRTVLLTPHKVPINTEHRIVKINAGQWHSCAINSKGELFTWGVGFQGRLGHGNKEPYLVPTKVGGALEGHKVVDVACGSFHTAALTESGIVFCWGDNSNGQCGSSALPEAVMLPNCVNSLCVVAGGVARSISCGRQHTAVVMKGPHQWCNNYCCQLRHDGKPQAEHGQLYVFGESKGMGLGTTQRVCVAKLVTGMEAYNIGAVVSGLHHTFIVADVIPPVPYS